MSSETILCAGCGITLRPFMSACPRCGLEREGATPILMATPLEPQLELSEPASASTLTNTTDTPAVAITDKSDPLNAAKINAAKINVVPFDAVRQQPADHQQNDFAHKQDVVFLSPNETGRRFPLFTAGQKTLIAAGVGLLLLLLAVAYLLWRQQRREVSQRAIAPAATAQASPLVALTPTPTPTPAGLADDAAISDAVKSALSAYNPLGFIRYTFEVKDGVVTINGDAEHQPEKEGVDNVIKLIAGVKSVVNNLKIKPGLPSALSTDSVQVQVNAAEAKILDDAMRRQAQANEKAGEKLAEQFDPQQQQQREAERRVREQAAAKLREDELAMKKAAEEKLRKDAEEQEKRQEDLRRAEVERRTRAEQAKLEASVLRSGTVAWSGVVDGADEVIISGGSASVHHVAGQPAHDVRASFSAPVPRSPVNVKLISVNGRGGISIVQEPSQTNGYTTIVRVDDSSKSGEKLHQFTLRWSSQ